MRALVVAMLCIGSVASAGPAQILVLRAEGTADTASRTSIDTHVLRLAKQLDGKIEAGDITLTEAAAAVGCNARDPSCKAEVLTTLGVDEIVSTTVTSTPTGLNVTVRRLSLGSARTAQTTIASGKSPEAKMTTDIGPLFGLGESAPAPEPKPVADTKPPAPEPKPQPAPVPAQPRPPTVVAENTAPIEGPVPPPPVDAITPPPSAETARNRRLQKIGMGVGGGFVLLSFLMWSQANDVQSQIDDKPEPRSQADIDELRDLEKKGDDIAAVGNLFFVAGAVLGGVSAYYYFRRGTPTSTKTARIVPVVFPGGAGVTLTFGGTP